MLKDKLYETRKEWFALIAISVYTMMVFMFDASEENIRFIYATYGILAFTLFANMPGVRVFRETLFLLLYLAFSALSILWSQDKELSLTRVRGVFLLVVMLIMLSSFLIKIRKPLQLLCAISLGGLALTVYLFITYGVSGVIDSIYGGERLGSQVAAVNSVAHSLGACIVTFAGICVFFLKKRWLLLLIPVVACFLAAESRTATLSLIVGILILVYCYIRSSKTVSTRVTRTLIALIVIISVLAIVRTLPSTRNLILKAENSLSIIKGDGSFLKESSTETRLDYIDKGWEQFTKSPVSGNGIGCAGYAIVDDDHSFTYLHNNYIELLASEGVIGFLLFYAPYILVLIDFIKRIFKNNENDPFLFIAFALLITKLIGHFGAVVYYSKIEFLLLTLWIVIANLPRKRHET